MQRPLSIPTLFNAVLYLVLCQTRFATPGEMLNGNLALRHAHFEVRQRTFLAHLQQRLPFSGEIAPLFIVRAGDDHLFLNESIDRFVSEALARNISLSLVNHPQGQHGFDVRNDNACPREIIEATLEFMKAHLCNP